MSERSIQRAIRHYLAARGYQSVHVPNGAVLQGDENARKRQMGILKGDGLMVGFPDLLVYGKGGRIGHIEVKGEGKKQQDSQKTVQAWLGDWGHNYAVCRSIEDATETLEKWGWA